MGAARGQPPQTPCDGLTEDRAPNTFSRAIRMPLLSFVKIVGSMNHPLPHSGRFAGPPPSTQVTPSDPAE